MNRCLRGPSVALLLSAVSLLGLTACGDDEVGDTPPCYTQVTPRAEGRWVRAVSEDGAFLNIALDDRTELRVPRDPQRIVSTLPGITETLDYLGAFNRVVAVSEHCDRPAGVDLLPAISVMPVNYEALTQLEPDLVLVDDTLSGADLEELKKRVPGLLTLRSRSLEDLRTSVDLLAQVIGTDEARERAIRFSRRLDDVLERVRSPDGKNPDRVLLLAQVDPVYALGPGSLLDDMLRACGAINLACDLGRPSGPFAVELVRARQPLWILTTGDPVPESLLSRWSTVPAVIDERVVRADADDLVRAGPRTLHALERLGDVLHGRLEPSALSDEP